VAGTEKVKVLDNDEEAWEDVREGIERAIRCV
jgi:hypothetical protein